jgi:hypothetical protein
MRSFDAALPRSWRFLLAEVAVTTVGILIALAANAWWTHRVDRATELVALREIRTALASDTLDLNLDARLLLKAINQRIESLG